MHLDSILHGGFNTNNKSDHIYTHSARIYKTDKYNAVVFSTMKGLPCIFAVPRVNFHEPFLAREKSPANCGYSTITLGEDEEQKALYHPGKMNELHEKVMQHRAEGNITHETMQIFLRMILPNRNE